MAMTTFNEKTYQGEIVKGITRHRDPLQCAIGGLAYFMALRLDWKKEPLFDRIANAATMLDEKRVPTLDGFKIVKRPLWTGHHLISSAKADPIVPATANLLTKDFRKFAAEELSVQGRQFHAFRHTHVAFAEEMEMAFNEMKESTDHDKGGVLESTYITQGTRHSVIFPDAGWPKPWQRTHVMGRSVFTTEWFKAEPWRSMQTWEPWAHLCPWNPTWASFIGVWQLVEQLLMPGDEALLQQYTSTAVKEEAVGPVLCFLPFIAWWRKVIVQDALLRLHVEPESQFFKVHPLFRNVLFRASTRCCHQQCWHPMKRANASARSSASMTQSRPNKT